jgi:hypothetical protein
LTDPLKEERVLKPVEMLLELEKHFNCLCVELKKTGVDLAAFEHRRDRIHAVE